jgi:hypothetical protein
MRQSSRLAFVAGLAVGLGTPALCAAESGPIVITEIMYNPHGTDEGQEWIEIYNSSNVAVNVSGWTIENRRGATTPFPAATTLAPHAVAVVVPRRGGVSGGGTDRGSTYVTAPANFAAAWGAGIQVIMVESFWNYYTDPVPALATLNGLANSPNGTTDALQLRDVLGTLVDEVAYLDDEGTESPWPDDNDGGSIQLMRDFLDSVDDNNIGSAWRLSEPGDVLGSIKANTVLPNFPGLVSYGTPGRLPSAFTVDCDGNLVSDQADIVWGNSLDSYPYNNIPDSCEGDCDANLVPDRTQILLNWRNDRNHNLLVDACEINAHGGAGGIGGTWDLNTNGVLDSFEAKPAVMITEILYDAAGIDDGKEFIEIYNASASPVNIGGWKLVDLEGDPVTGDVPAGTIMQPGEVIVLHAGDGPGVPANVATQFRTSWNLAPGVRTFALVPWQDCGQRATDIEEVLALIDATGQPVDVANYENPASMAGSTWPGTDGISSISVRPDSLTGSANDNGSAWQLSIAALNGAYDSVQTPWFTDARGTGSVGSPGIVWTGASQQPTGEVVITEIMANPNSSYAQGTRNEWIEIYNPTGAELDLSGWYLRDDDGRSGAFAAGTTLAAGGVAVIVPTGGTTDAATAEAEFRAAWGDLCKVIAIAGWSDREVLPNIGSLSNSPAPGKEVLTVRRGDGTVVDIVNFDDDGLVWPADAVVASPGLGTSWSIYLLAGHYTAADNDLGSNWAASLQLIDLADLNSYTPVFNGFDIGSPGLLPGVVLERACATVPVCIGDFNQDGGIDGSDIESFFLPWAAGENIADVNQDGGVDGGDIEEFFVHWEAGC